MMRCAQAGVVQGWWTDNSQGRKARNYEKDVMYAS